LKEMIFQILASKEMNTRTNFMSICKSIFCQTDLYTALQTTLGSVCTYSLESVDRMYKYCLHKDQFYV
jgi:hypothetical protein